MAIDLGDVYRLGWTNTSPGGGAVSSTNMKLTILLPDDSTMVVDPVVATGGAGVYTYDYLTTQPGRHVAQWQGTGTNPGAYVEVFDVRTLTPQYLVSLAQMRNQLKIVGTGDDEDLRTYIESATNAVELIRGEAVVKRSFTEEHRFPTFFRGFGQVDGSMSTSPTTQRRQMALNKWPVTSLTSVARVDGTMTWDVSLLHVEAASGVVDVLYGPSFAGQITVTYKAGYQVIPAEFGLAAAMIVEHLWQTRRGRSGVPSPGGLDTSPVPGLGYAVPNRAIELLGAGIPGFA